MSDSLKDRIVEKQMQVINKPERSSNLEFYRILVMLSIVAHHYVVNSGVTDVMKEDPMSFNSIYYYLFGAWGKVGINCFVLITGYFMCKSKITTEKFLKLLLEVYFYKIVISIIFMVAGYESVTLKKLFFIFMPVSNVKDGFTSCFLLFYLCIPFLNILVHNMTKRQHQLLLCLLLGMYTGLGTLLSKRVSTNYVTWFCVLYFISSYIRLYQPLSKMRWGYIVGGVTLLSVASIVAILYLGCLKGKNYPQYYFINDSYKVLAVVMGVSMFMWFKDMKIPQSRWINRIAQSCFGVLLIHANSDTMRQWLWKDVLDVAGQYHTDTFIIHSILSVLAIYIVCTIIDQLRIALLERPFFNWLKTHNIFKCNKVQ